MQTLHTLLHELGSFLPKSYPCVCVFWIHHPQNLNHHYHCYFQYFLQPQLYLSYLFYCVSDNKTINKTINQLKRKNTIVVSLLLWLFINIFTLNLTPSSAISSSIIAFISRPYLKAQVTWYAVLHVFMLHCIHAPTRSRHNTQIRAQRLCCNCLLHKY